MIWIFFIVTAMSTLLIKLGAISVMAGLLALALKIALVVILILAGLALWQWRKS